jgi:hypothetical protein
MQAFPSSAARTMAKRRRRHNRCMAGLPAEQGRKRLLFSEEKRSKKDFVRLRPLGPVGANEPGGLLSGFFPGRLRRSG